MFVQPPNYHRKKPSELPAVEAPHPGTSYRPAASDHSVISSCSLILLFDTSQSQLVCLLSLSPQLCTVIGTLVCPIRHTIGHFKYESFQQSDAPVGTDS